MTMSGGLATRLWGRWKPIVIFGAGVVLIGSSAFLSAWLWRENGLRALQAVSEQRVQLVANAVKAEINRQDHLPVVLSLDSDVRAALTAHSEASRDKLNRKLEVLSHEADTRALYILTPDGVVFASDDWASPHTLVGRNFSDRPYFIKAMREGKGSYLGVAPGGDRVRYYLSERVLGHGIIGIAVVRIEFDALEAAWQRGGERVLVTDANGNVFLSSDPLFKYRRIIPPRGTPHAFADPDDDPGYPNSRADPIEIAMVEDYGETAVVRVKTPDDASSYIYQSLKLPDSGWTIHRLADMSSVHQDQRDGAIIGGAVSALVISLLLYLLQRQRAYLAERNAGVRLKEEVAERTQELSEANASLRTEIEERRRTEARLRAMQNELVQAGKLAALGQMSAAIAHEINQPLAAIRTFMASTRIFAKRGDNAQVASNLDLINDLAERMANITAHLKTFARKSEPGRPEIVSIDRAIDGALFLIDGQIRAAGVRIEKDVEPHLQVRGYAVQLEQVMVNLIGNALDAVANATRPWIRIEAHARDASVTISVADNGSGFTTENVDRIFDPFYTTKPIGKGLGLGLSISYGIVQDFGGQIHAANRPEGGARVTVELPLLAREAALVAKAAHA